MNIQKNIEALKNEVKNNLILSALDINSKNIIFGLSHLLDLFFYFTQKDYSKTDFDELHLNKSFNNKILEIYNEMNKYLKNNYLPKEFSILGSTSFNNTSEFLSKLLENLIFYLGDYKDEEDLINIYYYMFHLIFYILFIFVKEKGINIFQEDNIKFYVYHIVHFFLNDKNYPEFNFFFYEGAFKYLSKRYNLSINYLFKLDNGNIISRLKRQDDIDNIIAKYYSQLLSKNNKTKNELSFIQDYQKIAGEINDIVQQKLNIKKNKVADDENKILIICTDIKTKVKQIKNKLDNYNLICTNLDAYEKSIDKLINNVENNNLTEYHFDLMPFNYNYNKGRRSELNKFLEMSEIWIKYNKYLEQDFTEIFQKIINSDDFQKLFITVMTSSHIKKFIQDNNLKNEYNIFINEYANEIWKYILFMPLTRGIKSFTSNYFRIIININSIDLIDIFGDKSKEEILKSYLLIILIKESFHFLFRLDKQGEIVSKVLSPQRKKLKEFYSDIGVDIILYLFGTEYINFISMGNSKLINDLDSWKNENTNFKVFKEIYLFCGKLVENQNKNEGPGLRCNISIYENNSDKWMVCTDGAVRFCF